MTSYGCKLLLGFGGVRECSWREEHRSQMWRENKVEGVDHRVNSGEGGQKRTQDAND